MAKVPDLDPQWWRKNRPLTLKSTGLADALQGYKTIVKKFESIKPENDPDKFEDSFTEVQDQLKKSGPIFRAIDDGLKAANKLLHKDAIESLNLYKTQVLPKEALRVTNIHGLWKDGYKKFLEDMEVCYKEVKTKYLMTAKLGVDVLSEVKKTETALKDLKSKINTKNENAYAKALEALQTVTEAKQYISGSLTPAEDLRKKEWLPRVNKARDTLLKKDEGKVDQWGSKLEEIFNDMQSGCDDIRGLLPNIEKLAKELMIVASGQGEEDKKKKLALEKKAGNYQKLVQVIETSNQKAYQKLVEAKLAYQTVASTIQSGGKPKSGDVKTAKKTFEEAQSKIQKVVDTCNETLRTIQETLKKDFRGLETDQEPFKDVYTEIQTIAKSVTGQRDMAMNNKIALQDYKVD